MRRSKWFRIGISASLALLLVWGICVLYRSWVARRNVRILDKVCKKPQKSWLSGERKGEMRLFLAQDLPGRIATVSPLLYQEDGTGRTSSVVNGISLSFRMVKDTPAEKILDIEVNDNGVVHRVKDFHYRMEPMVTALRGARWAAIISSNFGDPE